MGKQIFIFPSFLKILVMSRIQKFLASFLFIITAFAMKAVAQEPYHEQYRPQFHFSPKEKWTNDPNGMLFYKGIYHLFFQYYPGSTTWGPMHWGHATSKDLVHWHQEPIALYPDSLGYIFSGSAVADYHNSSGFGVNGQVPLVAIFTHSDPVGAKAKRNDFQNQSLAYSTDEGKTWTKYALNPVLRNPGVRDFRDPKVMWYEPGSKWVMTLATKDRVTFYSSSDLKNWKKEFGSDQGAHGGVWECPDLFTLDDKGKKVWVLIVNINPGGPNKGSATQYFLGDFDGNKFTPNSTNTKWIDYGPDEYAGITWSNTGDRKIFLGWMSNWMYANLVPTLTWRNAMTVPRELKIVDIGSGMFVASQPVAELQEIQSKPIVAEDVKVAKDLDLSSMAKNMAIPFQLNMEMDENDNFSIVLSNDLHEQLILGYDKKSNQYFIDRRNSGKIDFQKEFAAKHMAPRLSNNKKMNLTLLFDESSVELFGDEGLTVMTEIFFPEKPYTSIHLQSNERIVLRKLRFTALKGIWP
jgi:fructan beta-fructosidase